MYDTYAFMLQCRQSDTAFRQLTESQVSLKRLKDPIEFVEYVIEDKGVDINMTNDVNGLENANEDGVVYNGHYSNAEPQSFDLTADSDKEIQSGEEEVGDEILECPACLDAFGMISVLRTHLIEVHTMDSMCIMCNNGKCCWGFCTYLSLQCCAWCASSIDYAYYFILYFNFGTIIHFIHLNAITFYRAF